MSDNFTDKYLKADVCSSVGLRALPIAHFLSEFKRTRTEYCNKLNFFYDLLTTLSVGLVMSE